MVSVAPGASGPGDHRALSQVLGETWNAQHGTCRGQGQGLSLRHSAKQPLHRHAFHTRCWPWPQCKVPAVLVWRAP